MAFRALVPTSEGLSDEVPTREHAGNVAAPPHPHWLIAAVGLIALAGCIIAIYSTAPWGIGIQADSAIYFQMARSLLATGSVGTVSHFPPGYPFVLALFGSTLASARWLNVALFAFNIGLVATCVLKAAGPKWAAVVAACYVVIARTPFVTHISALSEPLALAAGIGAFVLVARGLDSGKIVSLVAGAAVAGLAVLVRYAAIIYPAAIVGSILLWSRWPARRRVAIAGLAGLLGVIPISAEAARNALATGNPGRSLAIHPIPVRSLLNGLDAISGWLTPLGHALQLRWVLGGVVFIVIGAIVLRTITKPALERPMSLLLAAFFAMYIPFVLIVRSFFDAMTSPNERILLPAQLAAVVLVFSRMPSRVPKWMVAVLFALGIQQVRYTVPWVKQARRMGTGFEGPAWVNSPLLNRVRALPIAAMVYSNGADVLAMFSGRQVKWLPCTFNFTTMHRNPGFREAVEAIPVGSYVAYFDQLRSRVYLPSERQLGPFLQLGLLTRTADGSIYQVEGLTDQLSAASASGAEGIIGSTGGGSVARAGEEPRLPSDHPESGVRADQALRNTGCVRDSEALTGSGK